MQRTRKINEKKLPYFGVGWSLLTGCFITLCLIWPAADISIYGVLPDTWFVQAFLITLIIVMLMMKIVDRCSRYFDKKIPWEEESLKRVLMQLIFGWVPSVAVGYLVAWVFLYRVKIDVRAIPAIGNIRNLIVLISLLLNSLYVACYFVRQIRGGKPAEPVREPYSNFLMIPDGNGEKRILVNEIAYISREENSTLIYSNKGTVDICYFSLDFLNSQLDQSLFFRANRSYIIAKDAVGGYSRQSDRKLMLNLIPKSESPTVVSRIKAKQFVDWLKAGKGNIETVNYRKDLL